MASDREPQVPGDEGESEGHGHLGGHAVAGSDLFPGGLCSLLVLAGLRGSGVRALAVGGTEPCPGSGPLEQAHHAGCEEPDECRPAVMVGTVGSNALRAGDEEGPGTE